MSKWTELSERMRRTGVFMHSRITPESLEGAAKNGRAAMLEDDSGEHIIGYAGIWNTPDPLWLELGAIWVAEERRGEGLGSVLYERRLALVPPGYMTCVMTGSDKAAHLAIRNGFEEISERDWFAKVPISVTCIPCDKNKVPGVHRPDCPYRAQMQQCRLFVRDFR